jgi:ribosomal protein L14
MLQQESRASVADNSGAKEVYIISVFGYKTKKRSNPKAGIGSMINVVISK